MTVEIQLSHHTGAGPQNVERETLELHDGIVGSNHATAKHLHRRLREGWVVDEVRLVDDEEEG